MCICPYYVQLCTKLGLYKNSFNNSAAIYKSYLIMIVSVAFYKLSQGSNVLCIMAEQTTGFLSHQ